MSRWIWILLALVVSTSVYFTIRYGLRPKPIPVLNPTEFQDLNEIGVVIYKRLRQNIRAERLLVLGSSPDLEEDRKIWEGLLKAAAADGEKIMAFGGEDLKSEAFQQKVKEHLQSGILVVVYGLTPEVSHLVDGSVSRLLDRVVQHPVMAISTMRLAVDRADFDNLQAACLDATHEQADRRRLDCAAGKVARKFIKRKLEPGKLWAVMEKVGLKEFLLYIHRPVASAPQN
jgi:hypothetical protein